MSMTESEAIRIVVGYAIMEAKNLPLMVARAFDVLKDSTMEAREYRAIGTVSEFQQLKEKATVYKYCPTCNAFVCDPQNKSSCSDCQTFIDWREGKG